MLAGLAVMAEQSAVRPQGSECSPALARDDEPARSEQLHCVSLRLVGDAELPGEIALAGKLAVVPAAGDTGGDDVSDLDVGMPGVA
jgi:hypothetical protein